MLLTWSWKLRPTRAQHRLLEHALNLQRQLYNAALDERIGAWRKAGKSISLYDQMKSLTQIRADDLEGYGAMPVAMSRWTLKRLDEAMQGFFRRVKASKGGAGFPRFRSYRRWHSLGFAEWSGVRLDGGRLRIKGFDRGIRINMHRPLPADAVPKSASITRKGRRWFVNIAIESAAVVERHTGTGGALGVDAGVSSLATFSDGIQFLNAAPARRQANALRRVQRALARCRRGSRRREKVRARLARLHLRVANTRTTQLHRVTAVTARMYSTIVVEDLKLRNMTRSARGSAAEPGTNVAAKAGLNRSVLDAGMGRLIQMLTYKAERSGGRLIKVNPRGTSQHCSGCGARVAKPLHVRTHACDACGLVLDRDVNAARNILARGLASLEANAGV